MPANSVPEQDPLCQAIDEFIKKYTRFYNIDNRLNLALIGAGLILGGCITIAGILNLGTVSAILGVFVAIFIGFQSATALGDKANFFRVIKDEGESIRTEYMVRYKNTPTPEIYNDIYNKFEALREYLIKDTPTGRGMQPVIDMVKALPGSNFNSAGNPPPASAAVPAVTPAAPTV